MLPKEPDSKINRHFTSVGKKLADDVLSTSRHFSDYISHQVYPNSFFFDPVTSFEIDSDILSKPLNKAYAKHILSDILATTICIINFSVQTGDYPSKFKHTKIIGFITIFDATLTRRQTGLK